MTMQMIGYYVKLAYELAIDHILVLLIVPITTITTVLYVDHMVNLTHILCFSLLTVGIVAFYFITKPRAVYLLDYACFKPPSILRVPFAAACEHGRIILAGQPESIAFQLKIFERSGIGEETCLPHALHYIPPNPHMTDSCEEAGLVIFSAMDSLLEKTGIRAEDDIDFLITNCSLFAQTPSLSSMVVNKYKMRNDVKSFSISGMGCSAGLISIDLARQLLLVYPDTNAVVISTEIITPNSYMGKERSMLLPNCLFRMGAAAILMTNKKSLRNKAKYVLKHVVRTHRGSDDNSYRCVTQEEDPEGKVGVSLNIDLMAVAGNALKTNIGSVGPLVLPASEKLLFLVTYLARKHLSKLFRCKTYIPDFKKAFEHICIHAGGRAVIDGLQKSLRLSDEQVEASRMTLHRFGNTSSSSLWYELSYIEAKGKMRRGDRVWQIAFGSGFKCNSAVWRCNRDIIPNKSPSDHEAWADCIDRYPVHIPEIIKL